MSLLQSIKKNIAAFTRLDEPAEGIEVGEEVAQLGIDVVQSDDVYTIYAQVAGANIEDIHIAAMGDGDIVMIEGQCNRPHHNAEYTDEANDVVFLQECTWGQFYRRIIFPQPVEIESAEAKIINGVLVIRLPIQVDDPDFDLV